MCYANNKIVQKKILQKWVSFFNEFHRKLMVTTQNGEVGDCLLPRLKFISVVLYLCTYIYIINLKNNKNKFQIKSFLFT